MALKYHPPIPLPSNRPNRGVASRFDPLGDTHIAAPHGGHVSPAGNVSPEEESEEEGKLTWRPCPECKALPEDGTFRLICLQYGQKRCQQCVKVARQAIEESTYKMLHTDANAWVRKHGGWRAERSPKALPNEVECCAEDIFE